MVRFFRNNYEVVVKLGLAIATGIVLMLVISQPKPIVEKAETVDEIASVSIFCGTGFEIIKSYKAQDTMVYELRAIESFNDEKLENMSLTFNARIVVLNANNNELVDCIAEQGKITYRR